MQTPVERENLVQSLVLEHGGREHQVNYFIENGLIFIMSEGREWHARLTDGDASDTVRELVLRTLRNAER